MMHTCTFSPSLLQPLRQVFERQIAPVLSSEMLAGGRQWRQSLPGSDFDVFSYNTEPLLWVSGHHEKALGWFQAFFDSLPLARVLPGMTRLYCGFFVVGNQALNPGWHDDYLEAANAWTLLTPLYPLTPEQGHLLYYPQADAFEARLPPERYVYTPGEALLIGHGLWHRTEPYAPQQALRVLVSLTFGGEDMTYWPALKPVLQGQSFYYRRPCGHASNVPCLCLWKQKASKFNV